MSPARSAILSKVRAAQRTALLPLGHERQPPAHVATPLTAMALTRFLHELGTLGVEVVQAPRPESVAEIVRARTTGLRVLSWCEEALPHHAFAALRRPATGSSARADQACADIGVTGCDAAVAETGSLVLLSGPGRSRTVSLLPPVHLAIVRANDIVPTLADALYRLDERLRTSAACTVITGPSRTADIELTLTLGIHGPGQLIVVIAP